jgi:hypothetical protein
MNRRQLFKAAIVTAMVASLKPSVIAVGAKPVVRRGICITEVFEKYFHLYEKEIRRIYNMDSSFVDIARQRARQLK